MTTNTHRTARQARESMRADMVAHGTPAVPATAPTTAPQTRSDAPTPSATAKAARAAWIATLKPSI